MRLSLFIIFLLLSSAVAACPGNFHLTSKRGAPFYTNVWSYHGRGGGSLMWQDSGHVYRVALKQTACEGNEIVYKGALHVQDIQSGGRLRFTKTVKVTYDDGNLQFFGEGIPVQDWLVT